MFKGLGFVAWGLGIKAVGFGALGLRSVNWGSESALGRSQKGSGEIPKLQVTRETLKP